MSEARTRNNFFMGDSYRGIGEHAAFIPKEPGCQ
jgi:hypothetical protein